VRKFLPRLAKALRLGEPRTPSPPLTSPTFLGLLFATLITYSLLFTPSVATATDYQLCDLGETCEIGEFLYDDDYTIYTGASCTLDAKDPDGNTFLSSQALTEEADGWYSHSFDTTGEDEGLYRATVCCTAGSDYLCLDKSWEIKTSTTPPTSGSISIVDNGGVTNDSTPDLLVNSLDADFMRFALSEIDLANADWLPYAGQVSNVDFSEGGDGLKQIWVEFKDAAGNAKLNKISNAEFILGDAERKSHNDDRRSQSSPLPKTKPPR